MRVPKVRDIRVAVHREPRTRTVTPPSRSVERKWRNVHDVALIRNYDTHLLDRIPNLTLHDQPVFSALRMVVAAILFVQRRQILVVPVDDIRYRAVIVDESAARAALAEVTDQ